MVRPEHDTAFLRLHERRRQRIVKLISIVYWLLIFEGALRKWVLPQYQAELFFLRDPFVLVIYFLCLKYGIWPRWQLWTMLAIAWAWIGGAIVLMDILSGMITSSRNLLLSVYGWRQYFFYMPLAFIIGECLKRKDLLELVKYTLLASIPIAVLSIFQASARTDSILNTGLADNPADAFVSLGVGLGFVRTAGTFSSNEGQALFIGSLIPMVLWVWILPAEQRPLRGLVLAAVTLAVATNLAVSGQRLAFVLAALVLATAFGCAALVSRCNSRRMMQVGVALTAAAVVTTSVLFPRQLNALAVRTAGAAVGDSWYSYGVVNRGLADFTHFTDLVPDSPPLGYGLGIGGNAATKIGIPIPVSAEDDWSRNIVDLGSVVGCGFIAFRIVLVLSLMIAAVRAARHRDDPLPMLMVGFIGAILLYGQITGQGTVNGYAWTFAGFCLAAS